MAATSQASGARAYAQALLDSAQEQGGLEAAHKAGDALAAVAAAWRADRRLRGYFLASEVGGAQKQAAFDQLGTRLPALVTAFLRLLARKSRLEILPAISEAAEQLLDERLGRVPVTLTTAVPMPPERLARWTQAIQSATGKLPVMKNVVQPELVAGAVVRIGDWIADGSVRRSLDRLEAQIIERAAR